MGTKHTKQIRTTKLRQWLEPKLRVLGVIIAFGSIMAIAGLFAGSGQEASAVPGGVANPSLWVRGDAGLQVNGSQQVEQWLDQSGSGVVTTQLRASQPSYTDAISPSGDITREEAGVNFNPSVNFTGAEGKSLKGNASVDWDDSQATIFGVAHREGISDGVAGVAGIWTANPAFDSHSTGFGLAVHSTNYWLDAHGCESGETSSATNMPRVLRANYTSVGNTLNGTMWMNGGQEATGTSCTTFAGGSFEVGGRTAGNYKTRIFKGKIAEVLVFKRNLSAADANKIETYLALKYGLTLKHNYTASDNSTVWDIGANSTYTNNVAGIGRDDTAELNQKQSTSSETGDIVTMGLGDIAATNQANPNTFASDRTFLVWGHNTGSTSTTASVDASHTRMSRVWKAEAAGSAGSVKVQVPTSALSGNDLDKLFVSDSADFSSNLQVIDLTTSGPNMEAVTAALSSGTHYFSFGKITGADIEFLSKTATDVGGSTITTYTPGEPIEYRLSLRNNGPDNAGTVTVNDTLPAGIVPTTTGATGGGWTCQVSGQNVTCTRSALNAGVTAPDITIEATIASSVTGQKDNTACASVANDPNPDNNCASLSLNAAPRADLSITKAHTGTPNAGDPLTYDFTVTNAGPSDVSTFTVTDNFDSDLTFSSSSAEVSCTGTTNVTCDAVAPLAAGGTRSFSITVDVDPSFPGGDITNTASVDPPTGTTDPNPLNNTSSPDVTGVTVSTDLSITKTHTDPFVAGETNDFTITVTNDGPSDAPADSITVTDILDEDFAYDASSGGTDWSCTPSDPTGGTVTCIYGAVLTNGMTAPALTLTVLVDSTVKGQTSNTAEVTGTTPDPDLANNKATDDPINIVAEADLAITKDHVEPTFTAGQQGRFTFTVVNNGPSADSPSYTITDTLPAGLTYAGFEGEADCSASSGQNVVCEGGGILANSDPQVTTITVDIDSAASGSFNNSATVTVDPSVTDPNLANNTDSTTVNVTPNADLAIDKAAPASMTAGDDADYTFTVTNNGPTGVSSYTITDTLDSRLSFQSSTPGGACSVTGTTPDEEEEITCTGGAIADQGQDIITITVRVASSTTAGATIQNTATVAPPADVNDPDMSNNTSDPTNNTVDTSADLAITKEHTGPFTVGEEGTFTITVTNNGPSDVRPYTITDTLEPGFTYVDAEGDAACSASGQVVTCTGGLGLGAGQSAETFLTVLVNPDVTASSIDNIASVSSATPDPDTSNNTTPSNPVTIDQAEADLTATKSLVGTIMAGQSATYRFEITNDGGPDPAGVVTIRDELPSYLAYQSFSSVSGGTWNCSSSGQDVTCTLPVLGVDDTAIVDITVLVAQDAPDTAENTASVTFNGTDPSPPSPSTSDPISHEADLEVQLSHESKTYHAGDMVTFTYTVINHGPSAARDVVLTHSLPDVLTFQSIIAQADTGTNSALAAVSSFLMPKAGAAPNTPFNCAPSGGDVVCTANTLYVGTYTLQMTAQINQNFTGDLTTVLGITSSTPDPNPSDRTASDTIFGVLPARSGLADTGQSLLAAGLAAAGVIILTWRLKRWRENRTSA